MIMWSILLYLSYWFDTINTIFPVSLVGILSFGKLEVLNEEETTWGMTLKERDGKPLTVNHRNMLVICIVLVAAGIFILSGSAYFLIQKLYSIAKHFYK